jgi:hypothetical protein
MLHDLYPQNSLLVFACAPRADDELLLAFIVSKSVQLASWTLLSHWLRVTSP